MPQTTPVLRRVAQRAYQVYAQLFSLFLLNINDREPTGLDLVVAHGVSLRKVSLGLILGVVPNNLRHHCGGAVKALRVELLDAFDDAALPYQPHTIE